ncbi:nucleotide exchange factor GrpE [Deferrisoma palaeochoriense]
MAEEREEERQEQAASAEETENPAATEPETGEAAAEEDRLSRVTAELEETRKKLLYLAAEFENYKKRTERRLQEAAEFGCEAVLRDLLPVLDNLERAVEHAKQAGAEGYEGLLEGLGHVIQQFHDVLGRHGVEPVPGEGEPFDPYVHEAMAQVEGEEHGKVHQVYEKGYRLKGRLLRPAKVVVTKVAAGEGDG